MHGLLRHLHGHQHTQAETAPNTTGNIIHWAKRYDAVVQIMGLGQAGRLRRQTVEFARITSGDKVLDVGCGTGDLTLLAKKRSGSAGEVCGIDASPEMIDVARRKAVRQHLNIDFRVDVIERLPFPDGTFDVVLSSLMMHHLPSDLKPKALAEIRRVLRSPDTVSGKPGGRLVIVEFNGLLEEQNMISLVKTAGFVQVERRSMLFQRLGLVRFTVQSS